jgi:hypothetical protein
VSRPDAVNDEGPPMEGMDRDRFAEQRLAADPRRSRTPLDRSGRRRPARLWGSGLVLLVGLAGVAAEPVSASSVSVQTQNISRPSPFSGPCTEGIGFAPGFAQETSVAVNPRDPRNILVAWIADGRATDLVMASRNGGRTFSRTLVPGLSACTGGSFKVASDPGVAFTADGRMAYFTAIVVDFDSPTDVESASTGMIASRSFDGGFSWSGPDFVQSNTGDFWDLPRLTPDPRRPKTAFYTYNQRLAPDFEHGYSVLSTTTNGGRTWSAARTMYDPQTSNSWPAINKILVNRDGSLLALFPLVTESTLDPATGIVSNPTQELAIRSIDGGRTWSEPVTVGSSSGRQISDPVTGGFLNSFDTFPSEAVAPNGDVYFSWSQPGATSSKVVVARSTNGGRKWKTRKFEVDGQAALPTVEVAPDGTVGVLYYQIAPSSEDGYWTTRVSAATSRDQGRHWSRHAVAGPFNLLTAGNEARPCCFLGDYLGSAPLPHGIAWAFSMGKPPAKNMVDAYFTRVTTSGR